MSGKAFRVTFPAILAALTVICLAISGVLPTGQLALAAVSSLFAAAAVVEQGVVSGGAVFLVSSVLSLMFAGDGTAAFFYVIFFGYYPVLKLWTDRLQKVVFRWGAKFLVLNAAVTAVLFLLKGVVVDLSAIGGSKVVAYIAANVLLVPYDLGISRLAELYVTRLSPKIKRGKS